MGRALPRWGSHGPWRGPRWPFCARNALFPPNLSARRGAGCSASHEAGGRRPHPGKPEEATAAPHSQPGPGPAPPRPVPPRGSHLRDCGLVEAGAGLPSASPGPKAAAGTMKVASRRGRGHDRALATESAATASTLSAFNRDDATPGHGSEPSEGSWRDGLWGHSPGLPGRVTAGPAVPAAWRNRSLDDTTQVNGTVATRKQLCLKLPSSWTEPKAVRWQHTGSRPWGARTEHCTPSPALQARPSAKATGTWLQQLRPPPCQGAPRAGCHGRLLPQNDWGRDSGQLQRCGGPGPSPRDPATDSSRWERALLLPWVHASTGLHPRPHLP